VILVRHPAINRIRPHEIKLPVEAQNPTQAITENTGTGWMFSDLFLVKSR
jgi:hypothetical protein